MTQDEWLKTKQGDITLFVYYEYYKEMGGTIDNYVEFQHYFSQITQGMGMMIQKSNGSIVRVSSKSAHDRLVQYYDNKFGITPE